jgi:2-phosphosulfolactate phosphatase
MKADVVFLPEDLTDADLRGRSVVVFDVLRATTTMAAALASGARQIRVFAALDDARTAARACSDPRLLCGEVRCLPPEGFDLGNSPGTYVEHLVRDKTLFMSTTNGTRAIAAARDAARLFVGALVNAQATAETLATAGLDVTLLCAGTDGAFAMEDLIGAGAVLDELRKVGGVELVSDRAALAMRLFALSRESLLETLNATKGAQNVVAAGLKADVEFAARLNVFDVVGEVESPNLTIRAIFRCK